MPSAPPKCPNCFVPRDRVGFAINPYCIDQKGCWHRGIAWRLANGYVMIRSYTPDNASTFSELVYYFKQHWYGLNPSNYQEQQKIFQAVEPKWLVGPDQIDYGKGESKNLGNVSYVEWRLKAPLIATYEYTNSPGLGELDFKDYLRSLNADWT